jgi:2-haloacid dehalogenase
MAPPEKPDLKVLLFDAYGTLFDVDSLIAGCDQVFPGRGLEVCRLWRAKQLEYTQLLNMMGRFEDFWQVTSKALVFSCRSLNLECPPEVRDRLLESYFQVDAFSDVAPALEVLSRHYPLAILSNGTPKMLKVAVEHNGLQGFLTQIISASEVNSYKPNLQLYRWACQKLGHGPDGVGVVSANAWDVTGARAFGFWTTWVNRRGAPWEDLGFTPDVTVSSLVDLLPVLGLSL